MIEHIVLLKFSANTTTEQKDELISRTLDLKKVITGVIDIQQGYNFSNRSKGYEIGLTVRLEDQSALETYIAHPAHLEILSLLKEIGMEDIIVVDFEIKG
jgi:hypothetical protein